jgi:hypothetical protein
VFFFSSGAVEQRWTRSDLLVNRLNVYIGFPLGGLLALALMVAAALVLEPRGIDPSHLSQAALPTSLVLGRLGLALALLGFFACTFGASLETALSCGYSVAQYFGWQWGKFVKPAQAPRFQLVVLVSISLGVGAGADHAGPDPADRVRDRAVGGGAAAHLPSPPDRGQRPRLPGRQGQLQTQQHDRLALPGGWTPPWSCWTDSWSARTAGSPARSTTWSSPTPATAWNSPM